MDTKSLKLNATSKEDIQIISAHLQDSITQVKNIAHLEKNKIFLIQFNSQVEYSETFNFSLDKKILILLIIFKDLGFFSSIRP